MNAKQVVAELKAQSNELARKVMIDLDQRVVLKTPVDTGRARSNWLIGLGNPERSSRLSVDQSGGATIIENTREILQSKPGQDIWLSNNLPYIQELETGSSRQAPQGMVSTSIRETARVFRKR